jgi:large subunit ribosomal protein L4
MSFTIRLINDGLKKGSTAFASLKDFSASPFVVAQTIRSEMLNLRAGNAHTKMRGEVRGGGRKPWRQKGTGRARHGSRRSPIWVGGGITFGPRNTRNWHSKINKTARLATLKAILKDRLEENNVLTFTDKFSFDKTKDAVAVLAGAEKLTNRYKDYVILYSQEDKEATRGFLNTDVDLMNVDNMKLHTLLNHKYIVCTPTALKTLEAKIAS